MKPRTLCLMFLLASSFWTEVSGQGKTTPPPPKSEEDEVVRVDTELVEVPVVVTDKTGKPVLNLKQNNFTIYEDGKTQELADFAATTAPFEVALLLDTSGSARSDLQLIQRAAQSFVDSLRPGDRVSIVAFKTAIDGDRKAAAPDLLTELTDSRAVLRAALERVATSNGTPYYDGIVQIVEKVFGKAPKEEFRGRRALVALTDGVDSTSLSGFEEARELLEEAGIISYFIQVSFRSIPGPSSKKGCSGRAKERRAFRLRRSAVTTEALVQGPMSNRRRTFVSWAISKSLRSARSFTRSRILK
jgi:VWFA-related protein